MPAEYDQVNWSAETEKAARILVDRAYLEDLAQEKDWTTFALLHATDADEKTLLAHASVTARHDLVLCGRPLLPLVLDRFESSIESTCHCSDGEQVAAGETVIDLVGDATEILTLERTLLNFLGHLSGIATLTHQYCDAIRGTSAAIYDTRKTHPGWRQLHKYAVNCGGGTNHRSGLFDGILIKDNHLAALANRNRHLSEPSVVQAVRLARELVIKESTSTNLFLPIEIEVDTLEQLRQVLPESPDIVLLDNMSNEQLREAVDMRNELSHDVVLEASGRVQLESVRAIAETGVDRISVGALTHSAPVADLGLDWTFYVSP